MHLKWGEIGQCGNIAKEGESTELLAMWTLMYLKAAINHCYLCVFKKEGYRVNILKKRNSHILKFR
ncbi:MAG: hypothetical protein UZ11_BCD004000990 [Bacteroidetes bacterium OLB11]|nr:MAG: hypothetical protein UZ11_BCD004000990 [Bacteroidetes bacterium OLB11]